MKFDLIYKNMKINEIKRAKNILETKVFTKVADVSLRYAKTKEPVPFNEKDSLKYQCITIGESWGSLFDCAWFHVEGRIDPKLLSKDLFLRFDISGEALLFNDNGIPFKGFTNGSSVFDRQHGEPGKTTYKINDFIDESGYFSLFLDCGCNDLFGNYQNNGNVVLAEIATKDRYIEKVYYDIDTCIDLLLVYPEDSEDYKKLLDILHEIYALVEYEEENMVQRVEKLMNPLFTHVKSQERTISALGHAHLDLAWLWPIRETKRKLLRTLTNVFYLLKNILNLSLVLVNRNY